MINVIAERVRVIMVYFFVMTLCKLRVKLQAQTPEDLNVLIREHNLTWIITIVATILFESVVIVLQGLRLRSSVTEHSI